MSDPDVRAVADRLPAISEEQVAAVIIAYRALREGDPVGTVVRDPDSGAVALRASENGIHCWKVSALDGGVWTDLQPRLVGWKVLTEGANR